MLQYSGLFLTLILVTAAFSTATVWFSIRLSHRLGILDRPDARKAHRAPVAYLGGLGMLLGFLCGVLTLLYFLPDFAITHQSLLLTIVLGAVLIFIVGFVDDVRPIPASIKLLMHIGVGVFMWSSGVRIERIALFGDEAALMGQIMSFLITVGWYVALMNSINLIDGLDGLAGGICFIGAMSLVGVALVIGYLPEVVLGAALACLIAGSTLGFLVFNWHPAKTFMGDGGSLLLGYLVATASLIGSTKTPTLVAMSVPLVALGLPLFETTFSFIRRAWAGQSPFKPDRRHLHHRLLDLGLDQRRVVIILLFFTALLGLNSIVLAQAGSRILFINVAFMVGGIILLIENLQYLEKQRESNGIVVTPSLEAKESTDVHVGR